MKRAFLTVIASLLLAPLAWSQSMSFDDKNHDFGDIKQGVPATYEFEFTNDGTAPLIISGAEGSCGCTVPEYPKAPIMPGKTGKIKVTYDAKNTGPFQKSVTIDSNDPNSPTELRIKGTVAGPAQ
ncbi:MAG: DUF1573 domain-containing protein [Flavobacteriales bacterium]